MMTENSKVWLITGSSSGFGRSLAAAALKAGERVIATTFSKRLLSWVFSSIFSSNTRQ